MRANQNYSQKLDIYPKLNNRTSPQPWEKQTSPHPWENRTSPHPWENRTSPGERHETDKCKPDQCRLKNGQVT
jgi:hypothetical protein